RLGSDAPRPAEGRVLPRGGRFQRLLVQLGEVGRWVAFLPAVLAVVQPVSDVDVKAVLVAERALALGLVPAAAAEFNTQHLVQLCKIVLLAVAPYFRHGGPPRRSPPKSPSD